MNTKALSKERYSGTWCKVCVRLPDGAAVTVTHAAVSPTRRHAEDNPEYYRCLAIRLSQLSFLYVHAGRCAGGHLSRSRQPGGSCPCPEGRVAGKRGLVLRCLSYTGSQAEDGHVPSEKRGTTGGGQAVAARRTGHCWRGL